MSNFSIESKLTKGFCIYIVHCIQIALEDDCRRYIQEFQPTTTNGIPHCIHDWINSNLLRDLPIDYRIFKFNRYCWKSNMIVDDKNKIVFTVMRQAGLKRVRNKKRTSPHYLQTFVSILNSEFEAKEKQLSFSEFCQDSFGQEILSSDFTKLCGKNLESTQGYRHCLIAFDTQNGQLSDVRAWVLDKNLDVFDEMCLNEYIKLDYSKLTEHVHLEQIESPQYTSNEGLLKLTNKSIIKLKEVSKEI